jgi:hypothetical protein
VYRQQRRLEQNRLAKMDREYREVYLPLSSIFNLDLILMV